MRLRISLEGQSYDVEVEILSETSGDATEFESQLEPPRLLRAPPPIDIRPEDKICRSPIAGRGDGDRSYENAAPVDGIVDAVYVVPGQSVKPGQPLCTLV